MSQHLDTLNAQCHLQGLNKLFLHLMRALHFCIIVISLTNRFQVAVRLFSNRSQMTSKCGKNKKEAHKAQPIIALEIMRLPIQIINSFLFHVAMSLFLLLLYLS